MKIFFDTEFIEDGKTIDLISIGLVREDNEMCYLVSSEFDASKANPWVQENVLKHIPDACQTFTRKEIAETILKFIGPEKPEFWGYYADYDWVVLCQLYGTMMDLPKGWPMFCRDLKQLQMNKNPDFRFSQNDAHHALTDAVWIGNSYNQLMSTK